MTPAAVLGELAVVLELAAEHPGTAVDAQRAAIAYAHKVRQMLKSSFATKPLDPTRAPGDYDKAMEQFLRKNYDVLQACQPDPVPDVQLPHMTEAVSAPSSHVSQKTRQEMSLAKLWQCRVNRESHRGPLTLGALGPAWDSIGFKLVAKINGKYHSLHEGLRLELKLGVAYEE
jgi:hypothetical protein